jgi:hypothetical protein
MRGVELRAYGGRGVARCAELAFELLDPGLQPGQLLGLGGQLGVSCAQRDRFALVRVERLLRTGTRLFAGPRRRRRPLERVLEVAHPPFELGALALDAVALVERLARGVLLVGRELLRVARASALAVDRVVVRAQPVAELEPRLIGLRALRIELGASLRQLLAQHLERSLQPHSFATRFCAKRHELLGGCDQSAFEQRLVCGLTLVGHWSLVPLARRDARS